jgi:hypothetical protein
MIRATAKLICLLTGLYCLLALADRGEWTNPLWAKIWPSTLLPRRPSPAEVHAADLDCRLETVKRQIADTVDSLNAATTKLHDLVRQLRDRLGGTDDTDDLGRLQADNPVAFALVRAVDAEDRQQAERRRKLADLEGQLARLEAQQIAAANGVSLTDPVEPDRPSDELRSETGDESADSRYRRIIREAIN